MDSIQCIVFSYLIFVNTLPNIEAGIFDPITDIFIPRDDNRPAPINSFLSAYRDTADPQPAIRQNKERIHRSHPAPAWWVTASGPVIHNIFNTPPTTAVIGTTPDYDAIIAQKFPEATNLLQRLREMNKKKEEQDAQGGVTINNEVITQPTEPTNQPLVDNTTSKGNATEGKPNEEIPEDDDKVMIPLTEKHFYFQVQPVRPDSEDTRANETIYYIGFKTSNLQSSVDLDKEENQTSINE